MNFEACIFTVCV